MEPGPRNRGSMMEFTPWGPTGSCLNKLKNCGTEEELRRNPSIPQFEKKSISLETFQPLVY